MIGVITSEKKIINDILNGERSSDNFGKNLSLLVKHYYIIEGITDKQELKEKIFELLNDKFIGYKRGLWENVVEKTVSTYLKKTREKKVDFLVNVGEDFNPHKEFKEVGEIYITLKELNIIKSLDDKKLEKVAFIMLAYAKINNIVLRENINWISRSTSEILKEAKINLKGAEKEALLYKLLNTKLCDSDEGIINYIEMSKSVSKNSFKINYVDTINEASKIEIVITDFESVIYYYLLWKGEKWKKCEGVHSIGFECDKWIKVKSCKPPKFCPTCAKKNKNELNKKYYKTL